MARAATAQSAAQSKGFIPPPAQAAIVKATATNGNTITVGCKLPNGIFLDLVARPGDPIQRFKLRGSNAATIAGGYGITDNVPREFFEEWLKRHAVFPPVVNGLIFSVGDGDRKSVKSEAHNRRDLRNGLEGLDPKAPPKGIKADMDVDKAISENEKDEDD